MSKEEICELIEDLVALLRYTDAHKYEDITSKNTESFLFEQLSTSLMPINRFLESAQLPQPIDRIKE